MASAMLDELYYHLTLPPQLPGRQDNLAHVETALLERLHSTAVNLRDQLHGSFQASYEALKSSLKACRSIHLNHTLERRALAHELLNIQPKTILILHIAEQNAGLLIWRQLRYDIFTYQSVNGD